jgi:hypothetical protein
MDERRQHEDEEERPSIAKAVKEASEAPGGGDTSGAGAGPDAASAGATDPAGTRLGEEGAGDNDLGGGGDLGT